MRDDEIERVLARALAEGRGASASGRVASYIPALGRVSPEKFGLALCFADGREFAVGDADESFSIQSVSKVFTLAYALDALGDALWDRVGREASGMSFNSLILLEQEHGRPRNPLINAGAIVTSDALLSVDRDWATTFAPRLEAMTDGAQVSVDPEVHASEAAHGDLNRAIAWFLKAKGNLRNAPEQVTDCYFRACATAMSPRAVARAGRFLIGKNHGADLCRDPDRRRRIRAVMRTCGLYDAAGDFAFRVGLPAKSGVGGGILAVAPGQYSVCVWSPPLDAKGNSVGGVRALEIIAEAFSSAP